MPYKTRVLALSREEVQRYHSSEPYVVISLTDTNAEHPIIRESDSLKGRLALHFDDIYPGAGDIFSMPPLCEMTQADAARIASFVHQWWGKVATVVVNCHAGLSRSTGVAAAIRAHHQQDDRDLFESPRSPNRHCLALVAEALNR